MHATDCYCYQYHCRLIVFVLILPLSSCGKKSDIIYVNVISYESGYALYSSYR
jgi:hypothetical protein